MMYPNSGDNTAISNQIAADASNIRSGGNPAFTLSDFLSIYPGFSVTGQNIAPVPNAVLQMYIDLALTCVQQARFRGAWKVCIGYFVAHFATLWLEGTADPNSPPAKVLAVGQAKGLVSSKSANDLSVSYDYSTIAKDLDGWAAWTMTNHGRNLATLAKLYGKGGMVVR